ncbi:hypothetical protein CHU32_24705 [Superficieibacter electus]|uniref:Uncharacterized protein n=1 Tax=Superficieibacter electus TaxID=2022662 RepID=A0A2P5GI37_9ENTR|nr:hypothetical protein [Superficieibacter electus]POP41766.1 hypothetical protein CHU33_21920 [Superficieibacter electus]POP42578.1 hypothetical protein CHU32_24705 [Superficieibacter electus]
MKKESELQSASLAGYKLFALLKVAAFSGEELEPIEAKAIFELAYDLSVPVSSFILSLEQEALNAN